MILVTSAPLALMYFAASTYDAAAFAAAAASAFAAAAAVASVAAAADVVLEASEKMSFVVGSHSEKRCLEISEKNDFS